VVRPFRSASPCAHLPTEDTDPKIATRTELSLRSCEQLSVLNGWLLSLSENYRTLGPHRSSVLAELVAALAEIFHSIPDIVSDAADVVLQPLEGVTLAVHDVGVTSSDTVAVVGSGITYEIMRTLFSDISVTDVITGMS